MDIFELLNEANDQEASDLHLVVASPPLMRVQGRLRPVNGSALLTSESVNDCFLQITTPQERETFHQQMELDFGYTLPSVGRLRCNAAQQRGVISLAIRLLPPTIPSIEELELPDLCRTLIEKQRGLVIVTGPTGSGKSTTLAAMLRHLNHTASRHIVTIEDPIEYVHNSATCAITQRELGSDTISFTNALKHVLRQDPDVILVGEMRDLDTAAAILTLAETGHLVVTTGHAPSATQAVERIVDLFPPHERHLSQARIASLLVGILCQALVPRKSTSGRIAAVEILLANPAVRALIRDGKIYQLPNVIRTNREMGMISLDEALVNLFLGKQISGEVMLEYCNDRAEVEKLIGNLEVKGAKTRSGF